MCLHHYNPFIIYYIKLCRSAAFGTVHLVLCINDSFYSYQGWTKVTNLLGSQVATFTCYNRRFQRTPAQEVHLGNIHKTLQWLNEAPGHSQVRQVHWQHLLCNAPLMLASMHTHVGNTCSHYAQCSITFCSRAPSAHSCKLSLQHNFYLRTLQRPHAVFTWALHGKVHCMQHRTHHLSQQCFRQRWSAQADVLQQSKVVSRLAHYMLNTEAVISSRWSFMPTAWSYQSHNPCHSTWASTGLGSLRLSWEVQHHNRKSVYKQSIYCCSKRQNKDSGHCTKQH